jgi:hypothetical protein
MTLWFAQSAEHQHRVSHARARLVTGEAVNKIIQLSCQTELVNQNWYNIMRTLYGQNTIITINHYNSNTKDDCYYYVSIL